MTQPQFDPTVIERYAEQLYRKADSVRVGSGIAGAVLGVIFGAVPVSPLGPYLPIPSTFGMATILLGALIGGFIGYAVGEGRAFRVRLQAQMVLFQLQLERNTAGRASEPAPALLQVPVAAPVAAPVLPAVPRPAPVATAPQPVAPPPPVAVPELLIPVQPAAAVAPPAPPAPAPFAQPAPAVVPVAPRPPLEAVPPLDPAPLTAVPSAPAPAEHGRPAEELAPPLLPPLSPSATSGA